MGLRNTFELYNRQSRKSPSQVQQVMTAFRLETVIISLNWSSAKCLICFLVVYKAKNLGYRTFTLLFVTAFTGNRDKQFHLPNETLVAHDL